MFTLDSAVGSKHRQCVGLCFVWWDSSRCINDGTWLHDDSEATCTNFVLGSVTPGKTMYISNNVANGGLTSVVVTSSDIGLLTLGRP